MMRQIGFEMPAPAQHRSDRRRCSAGVLAAVLASLVGCQAVPGPWEGSAGAGAAPGAAGRGYTDAQVRLLREAGFRATADGWELGLNVRILFDVDDDRVRESAQQSIVRLGRQLRDVDIQRLRVEGHTDNTGPRVHNEQLSLRRATAVGRVLSQAGFEPGQLQFRGLGAAFPVADNGQVDGRAENRRVAIVVPPQI